MKRIIILSTIIMMAFAAHAQNNAISKYFSKYTEDTAFTKVTITSKMFSLFTEIEGEDEAEKELLEAMGKLKGIKAIIGDDPKDPNALYRDVVSKVSKDKNYEELMSIEDGKENVKFMIRDNNGIINELLMIIGGQNEFLIMTLYGEIDLKKIGRLSKIMKVEGLDRLKMLDGGDKDKNKD